MAALRELPGRNGGPPAGGEQAADGGAPDPEQRASVRLDEAVALVERVAAQLGDLSAERVRLARRERELRDERRALAAAEHQAAKAACVKREVEMAQRLTQLGRATARRPRTA